VDGTWYAFATASGGKNMQAASAPAPEGPWTYIDSDLMPSVGSWTDGLNTWAPDVRVIRSGGGDGSSSDAKYVVYYSGELANNSALHCIGAATSQSGSILGPYEPQTEPFACPYDQGGAIDPSGYWDEESGRRYVLYKTDGNAIGHGGECNNGVAPQVPTPIMLQEVDANDGITKIGSARQIFDRIDDDGPLVEAPNLVRMADSGVYVLFYSSHCWVDPLYSVSYATADSVEGPYTRGGKVIQSGDNFNLTAPGGATGLEDGAGWMVFHANCLQGRCLFGAEFELQQGKNLVVLGVD